MSCWRPRPNYTGGSFEPKYDKMQWPLNAEGLDPMRWIRSAMPKVWPYVLVALVVGLVSSFFAIKLDEKQDPFPFSAFSTILGFMLVFRTNIAYQRYWEARSLLEDFDSKLTDVLVHTLALDRSYKASALQRNPEAEHNLQVEHQRFKNITAHLLSLMHAVAFCTLRDDFDLYNLTVHFSGTPLLVTDADGNPTHPDLLDKQKKKQLNLWQRLRGALPCGQKDDKESQVAEQAIRCPAKPVNDSFPLKFRHDLRNGAKTADYVIDEEIPGSILEARRQWSAMWTWRPDASVRGAPDRRWMHRKAKLAVLGGLSAAEAISLGAPATDQRPWLDESFQVRRRRFDEGINEQARCIPWLAETCNDNCTQNQSNQKPGHADKVKHLPAARERVQVIHSWLVDILTERMSLGNSGPSRNESAQSCILQCLSSAMLSYQNCRKLSTHQLPWAWYQACYWSLWLFAVLMPITVSLYAEPKWTTWTKMLSSVLIVAIYATLHEVANYTEEPFRFYPMLIPLQLKQISFNERLVALMDARRPMGPADIFKSITNPIPFQACRWLSQGGASLENLRCVNREFSEAATANEVASTDLCFEFVQDAVSEKSRSQTDTRKAKPFPFPRHRLARNDRVTIFFDAAFGRHKQALQKQSLVHGEVIKIKGDKISVKVTREDLEKLGWKNEMPDKRYSIVPDKRYNTQKRESRFTDACFGCAGHKRTEKDGNSQRAAHFQARDDACQKFLKEYQLDNTDVPEAHVLTLYRYMDISCCRLCTSICDALDTRNKHWLGKGFFDPLLHDTRCRSAENESLSISSQQAESRVSGRQQTAQNSQESTGTKKAPQLGLEQQQMEQLRRQYAPSSLYKSTCICWHEEQHGEDIGKDGYFSHRGPEDRHVSKACPAASSELEERNDCYGSECVSCSQFTCGCVEADCTCSACVDERHPAQFREGHSMTLQFDPGQQYSEAPGMPCSGPDPTCGQSLLPCPQDKGMPSSRIQPPLAIAVQQDSGRNCSQQGCAKARGRRQHRRKTASQQVSTEACKHGSRNRIQGTLEVQPAADHSLSSTDLITNPVFDGPTSVRVDK